MPQLWECRDFSEGIIDSVENNLLPENAASDCQNWISRKIGSLKKRSGQRKLNSISLGGAIQGLHSFYYGTMSTTRRLIVAANGVVSSYDGTAFTELKTGLDTTAPTMFETCVNYMVAFNGVDAPWKWDGTTVSALSGAPATGQFAVLHKEKLFTVPKSNPSQLQWSESFAPEDWPAVNYWDVKTGDGDVITCLKKHLGELVIFKRRSTHTLSGTNLDDFSLNELDTTRGCAGPFAAVSNGLYLYFVSDEGICVFNGMQNYNLSEERIPGIWSKVNKANLHKAAVYSWDGLILFALPEGESTTNNMVIVYDPPVNGATGGKFWIYRGINATCFQPYDTGSGVVLYSGDYDGYIQQQDVGTDDNGVPINAYWIGKVFDQGVPEYEKKADFVYVQDSRDTENVVTLQASVDGGDFAALTLRETDGVTREFTFSAGTRWRDISFKLIHNALGACEVKGLMMPYRTNHRPYAF